MSNKITIENFDPLSIKVVGKKKVEIKFFDREHPNRRQTNDDSNLPHQDLIDRMNDFREEMARALEMTPGWDFAVENIRENLEATKTARDAFDKAIDNVTITGVNFYGDQKPSVQLHASIRYAVGTQAQSTPRLPLKGENATDYSENLVLKSEELKIEIYKYLFEDKFTKSEKKPRKSKNDPESVDPAQTNLLEHAAETEEKLK